MQRFIAIVKQHPFYILAFVLMVFVFVIILLGNITQNPFSTLQNPSTSSTPPLQTVTLSPAITQKQETFSLTITNPSNGQANVYPGEILISFTSSKPILSKNAFDVQITPTIPHYLTYENSYPTNEIKARVTGGLKPATAYTITVSDQNKKILATSSFTTSASPAESSTGLVIDEEKRINEQYFPLFAYVPYVTKDFVLDYTDKLTLEITIHRGTKDRVAPEVLAWIKSKGVDPSTHTINYVEK